MNNDDVMKEMRSDTPLNRARVAFSGAAAAIEQAAMQRRPPGSIEVRRMEFEAVGKILAAAGFPLPRQSSDLRQVLHSLMDAAAAQGLDFDDAVTEARRAWEEGRNDPETVALKARVVELESAPANVLKMFESRASGLVPAEHASGYREAVEHIQSEMEGVSVKAGLKARVAELESAPANVLKTFESLVAGMISADYATGYREAIAHVQSVMAVAVMAEADPEHDAPVPG